MKKLLCAIIIIFVMFSVIAVTDDSNVNVYSYVIKHDYDIPSFSLIGIDIFGTQLTVNSATTLRQKITQDDIEVEFSIVQINMSDFSGTIYLDIDVTPFSSDEFKSPEPEITNIDLVESDIDSAYADKRFILNYNSLKSIESVSIGSFKIKWKSDNTLPDGNYKASVSMTCTLI